MHCYLLISLLFFSFAKTEEFQNKQIIPIEYGVFIEGTSSATIVESVVYQIILNPNMNLYRIAFEVTSQLDDLLFVWENVTTFNFNQSPGFISPCSTDIISGVTTNQFEIISQISFPVNFRFLIDEINPLLVENQIIFSQSCCTTGQDLQYIINITDDSLPLRIFFRYFDPENDGYRFELTITRDLCSGSDITFPSFDESDPPIRIFEIRLNSTDPNVPTNFYQNGLYFISFDLTTVSGSVGNARRLNNYIAISYCLGNNCMLDFNNLTPPNTQSTIITNTGIDTETDTDIDLVTSGVNSVNTEVRKLIFYFNIYCFMGIILFNSSWMDKSGSPNAI